MQKKVYTNPLIGDKAVFLKTAAETNGEYSLIEVELAPGGGNTLHSHRDFTETFVPLEGELLIRNGDRQMVLKPGEKATVPVNALHLFKNPGDKPIKFHVELRPGHSGFENCIKIAYGLATDGLTTKKSMPKSFSHAAILLTLSGTYPNGIFSLLVPLLKWQAARARKKGIEKMLMDKYCR